VTTGEPDPRARRVVLDNCVPRTLIRHLTSLDVRRVEDFGWADEDDGPLLRLIEPLCDVFVTVDRNLPFQQRLDHRPFATVVLRARTNRVSDLLPLVPRLLEVVPTVAPGSVSTISR
jgi:hypothetical protein